MSSTTHHKIYIKYPPEAFVKLVEKHGIPYHEKKLGQLFCDRSAEDLINMLLAECAQGGITRWQGCAVGAVRAGYEIDTAQGVVGCRASAISWTFRR